MKCSIRELQKTMEVEKRKLEDYEFKLKQLKEHELILYESIDDANVNILDYEETLQVLERMEGVMECSKEQKHNGKR